MDVDRFGWLEIWPILADQARSQLSDCCWATVSSFCVSSKYIIEHNILDSEWLSSQNLIDYALEPFRDYANIDPLTGEVIFDQYNCYGLKPVASLMFAGEYAYLRNTGPMMGTVLITNEFRDYKGTQDGDGIIRVEGTAGVDLAHSVTIIGMDRTMRCFRIQNSHTLQWGDYRKGWILYELVYYILSIGMTSLDPTDNYVYPTQEFSFSWYREYYAFGAPGPRCHKDLKEYNDPAKPDLPHLLEWYFRSGLDRCIWIICMISAYCHPNVEKWMEKLEEFEIKRRLTIRTCIVAVALFVLFLMYHYFAATEIYNAICMFIAAYVWMTGFGNFSYFYIRQDFIVARSAQMMWRLNIFVAFACIVLNNDHMLYYICAMHTLFTLMLYGALGIGNKYNEIRSVMIIKICTCFLLVILIWEVPEVFDLLWFPLTFLLEYNDPAKPNLPRFHESHFRFRLHRYTWIIGMIYAYCRLNAEKWMEKLEESEIKRRLAIRTCIVAVTLSVWYLWYGYTCKLDKVTYRSNMPNGQPKWLLCLIPDYSILSLMLMTAIYILISCCLFELTNSPEPLFITIRDNRQLLYNFLAGAAISAFTYLIAFILVQIIT